MLLHAERRWMRWRIDQQVGSKTDGWAKWVDEWMHYKLDKTKKNKGRPISSQLNVHDAISNSNLACYIMAT